MPRRGFTALSATEGEGAGAAGREVRSGVLAPGGLLRFFSAAALRCSAFLPPASRGQDPEATRPQAQLPDRQKRGESK